MNRIENLKSASERLKEAQQLLKITIEKGSISSIDRDLVLEKLRIAYDYILFEKEIKKPIVLAQPAVQPLKVKVEKVPEIPSMPKTPEVKIQDDSNLIPVQPSAKISESPKTFERTSIFDPSIKGLSVEKEETNDEDDQKAEKPKEQSILNKEQPESIAERFQGKRKFMTDSLSNQFKEKPVASQLQDKPISDLTKEIGVHDKFMFIKELFNGDSKSYEDTVNRVNQLDDIADAIIYIQENFSWNDNNKAANKFIDLIRRKLLKN